MNKNGLKFAMPQNSEPLDPETWFNQIERVAKTLSEMDGESPDACIRRAFHIANLAPAPLRPFVKITLEEEVLERLLECGAYASAVVSLLHRDMGLTIARLPTSQEYRADVSLPHEEASGKGQHDSLEKAVLEAWAKCLLALREAASTPIDQGQHKSLSVPHRNLTEH